MWLKCWMSFPYSSEGYSMLLYKDFLMEQRKMMLSMNLGVRSGIQMTMMMPKSNASTVSCIRFFCVWYQNNVVSCNMGNKCLESPISIYLSLFTVNSLISSCILELFVCTCTFGSIRGLVSHFQKIFLDGQHV